MTIEELKNMPVGTEVENLTVTIKTAKRPIAIDKKWYQVVNLFDGTDDILADVKIGVYAPLQTGAKFEVIFGITQNGELSNKPIIKLRVDAYHRPAVVGDPGGDYNNGESTKVIRGKIITHLVSGIFAAGHSNEDVAERMCDPTFDKIVNWILEG